METVAALGSEEENCVVRIIRDRETGTFRAYVASADPRIRSHALLSLPAVDREVKLDESGRGSFQAADIDWSRLDRQAALRTAVERCSIGPDDGNMVRSSGDNLMWRCEDGNLHIHITSDASEGDSHSIAVVEFQDGRHIVKLNQGEDFPTIPA